MFLKNINIIFKIRRSKVTDYAALRVAPMRIEHTCKGHLIGILSKLNYTTVSAF